MENKKDKNRINTTNISKIIRKSFCCKEDPMSIKVFDKTIFNYPKYKKLQKMFWNSRNIINIELIQSLTEDLLTNSNYKGVKVIHPYLLLLSWDKIKKFFIRKYCESTNCYEIITKQELDGKINYRVQTRETLKIASILISNTILKEEFPDYYSYLIGEKGISVEEYVSNSSNLKKTKHINIKFSFDDKISILVEINESHKDRDYSRTVDILSKTGSIPVVYNQDKQDMFNIIPKIYTQFAYSIAKVNVPRAIKFFLIVIEKLNPIWVNFCIDNLNENHIKISEISDMLEIYGMEKKYFKKYITKLYTSSILDDDNISYYKDKILKGTVTQCGCDILFMRLENKYFSNKDENFAGEMCKNYSKVKQKYLKTLDIFLSHNSSHFKIISKERNELAKKYKEIKPIKSIIYDMVEIFNDMISEQTLKDISDIVGSEIHPRCLFLVRQENRYIDKHTFEKVTKLDYQSREESSSCICNYRWITEAEWTEVKSFLETKLAETETETN